MPPLKNRRHELFCQNLVKGMSQAQAYREAGYTQDVYSSRVDASQLLTNPNIKERVEELESTARNLSMLSKEWVLDKLITVADRCLNGKEHANAISALKLLGMVNDLKMFTEVKESRNINKLEDLTPGELQALKDDLLNRSEQIKTKLKIVGDDSE